MLGWLEDRWFAVMTPERRLWSRDAGLLLFRLYAGGFMLFGHGLPKLLGFAEKGAHFPDPLGLASLFGPELAPQISLGLVIFAELVCTALLMLGLLTRLATIPLIITMVVAAFVIHGNDGFAGMEFALLYLAPYMGLLLTGPGALSLDRLLARWSTTYQPLHNRQSGPAQPPDAAHGMLPA